MPITLACEIDRCATRLPGDGTLTGEDVAERKEKAPVEWTRQLLRCGLIFIILVSLISSPSLAGDKAKSEAKEEMKWGVKAAKRGYWLEALTRFEHANQLVPNQSHVLNNIAVALEASGRFEEAMVTYETAIAVTPNDRVLQRNFSQFKEFYDTYVAPPAPKVENDEAEGEDQQDGEQGSDTAGGADDD
jgi:tetratricopeptide (TPR) repeat protein